MAAKKSKSSAFQLKIRGVPKGRVPVPELIRICEEIQRTVNRQAEASEGKKSLHPGPSTDFIQENCTLELVGLGPGSAVLKFDFAAKQTPLPYEGVQTYGSKAIREVAVTIKNLGNGNTQPVDEGVLQSLYKLGSVVGSGGITEIQWIAPGTGKSHPRVVGTLTKKVYEQVAKSLSQPRRAIVKLDGILDMASFRNKERKCRITPAIGSAVLCTFDVTKEDAIYSLLRKPVRATGIGIFQANTDKIESVEIDTIEPLPSLSLGEGNFFKSHSIDELAEIQGTKPIKDISSLPGRFSSTEEMDDFLKEIYEARK